MNNKSITLLKGDNYIEGNSEEGITKVIHVPFECEGLNPGEWDFYVYKLISEGCYVVVEKEVIIRIVLNKKEKWKKILKLLPKGSYVKKIRQVR